MRDTISSIRTKVETLLAELEKAESGNKAAGMRARKETLNLEKLFKEFRRKSIFETRSTKSQ